MTDDRSAIRERIVAVTEARDTASDVLDAATDERKRATGAHRVATEAIGTSDIDVARPRRIEMEIATLRGRIEERSRVSVAPTELTEREQVVSVLKAAEQIAKVRSDKERTELLNLVSTDITELGQALGFAQLESAKFQANCHLPVVKGGEPVNFGSLARGEMIAEALPPDAVRFARKSDDYMW